MCYIEEEGGCEALQHQEARRVSQRSGTSTCRDNKDCEETIRLSLMVSQVVNAEERREKVITSAEAVTAVIEEFAQRR